MAFEEILRELPTELLGAALVALGGFLWRRLAGKGRASPPATQSDADIRLRRMAIASLIAVGLGAFSTLFLVRISAGFYRSLVSAADAPSANFWQDLLSGFGGNHGWWVGVLLAGLAIGFAGYLGFQARAEAERRRTMARLLLAPPDRGEGSFREDLADLADSYCFGGLVTIGLIVVGAWIRDTLVKIAQFAGG